MDTSGLGDSTNMGGLDDSEVTMELDHSFDVGVVSSSPAAPPIHVPSTKASANATHPCHRSGTHGRHHCSCGGVPVRGNGWVEGCGDGNEDEWEPLIYSS